MTPRERQFADTVRRVEAFAKRSPRAYTIAVAAVTALGYFYVVFVLLFAIALFVGLVVGIGWLMWQFQSVAAINALRIGVPIAIALGLFIASVFRALWVILPAPDGPQLSRAAYGRLFSFLDDVADRLDAPHFDHVIVSDAFNAGVVQVPRFGLIGPSRNYLMIGLPLMKAVSTAHFRAIIAHELGHISGNHSRFASWIYRQRQTWLRIIVNVQHSWVFAPFFYWYIPYFMAYTFVLARSNEYVADKCAAEVSGGQTFAEALVATEVHERYLTETYWPWIYKHVLTNASPNVAPYTWMFPPGRPLASDEEKRAWLMEAWVVRTDIDDTHPSLADRLAALGFQGTPAGLRDAPRPALPPPGTVERSAADDLLVPLGAKLMAIMDDEWRSEIGGRWAQEHNEAIQKQRRLDVLYAEMQHRPLTVDEMIDYAKTMARFQGEQAAAGAAWMLARAYPLAAKAQAVAGVILLKGGDANGIDLIETAAKLEPSVTAPALGTIAHHLMVQGRWDEAERYRQRAEEAARLQQMTQVQQMQRRPAAARR